MAGLGELVEGYERAQEQKARQARTLADQEAKKFEQQYRLDQAKQQASYQAQQIDLEKDRVRTENFSALQNAIKKQADISRDRDKIKVAEDALDLREKIHNNTLNANDHKALMKEILDKQKEYEKSYGPERARDMAESLLGSMREHILETTPGGQATPGAGAQAPPQQQPQGAYGSLDYLNSLGVRRGDTAHPHALAQPSETPTEMQNVLPSAAAALQKTQQQIATSRSTEELHKANTLIANANADAAKAFARAKAELEGAKVGQAKASADLTRAKAEAYPAESRAHIAHEQALAKMELNSISVANASLQLKRREVELKETEAALKNSSTRSKASADLSSHIRGWEVEKNRLGTDKEKLVKMMADQEMILRPGYLETQINPHTQAPYTPAEARIARENTAKQFGEAGRRMNEITFLQRVTDRELTMANRMALQNEIKTITGPDGKPDKKATAAAIQADSAEVARLDAELKQLQKEDSDRQKRDLAVQQPAPQAGNGAAPYSPQTVSPLSPAAQDLIRRDKELKARGVTGRGGSNTTVHRGAGSNGAKPVTKTPIRKGAKGRTKSGATIEIIGIKD